MARKRQAEFFASHMEHHRQEAGRLQDAAEGSFAASQDIILLNLAQKATAPQRSGTST